MPCTAVYFRKLSDTNNEECKISTHIPPHPNTGISTQRVEQIWLEFIIKKTLN
jgi:hypothetical protein